MAPTSRGCWKSCACCRRPWPPRRAGPRVNAMPPSMLFAALAALAACVAAPCGYAATHVLSVRIFHTSGDYQGAATGIAVSTPAGIQCPPQCSAAFEQGTQVVLTAAPPQGMVFAGFGSAPYNEDDCLAGTCRIVMSTQKDASVKIADLQPVPTPYSWFTALPFPSVSVNTTESRKLYFANAGTGTLTIQGLAPSQARY